MDEIEIEKAPQPGVYLIGTPIGNLEDITLRALRILRGCEVLACEDTRVTRKLFQRHNLPAPAILLACNDHNERAVAKRLAGYASSGKAVGFCSDAGMPGVSDPGYHIVREAREAGVMVEVIPGPSAVTTAVALSGLGMSGFTFLGFPPRRDGRVRELLREYGALRCAMVFYESPRRLARLLELGAEVLGESREAAVCLEMTKKFERVLKGSVGDLAQGFRDVETRGEAVVVVSGAGRGNGSEVEEEEREEEDERGG